LIQNYQGLILDVDGVILDSNNLKEDNIREAVRPFTTEEECTSFVEYFTSLNGVPREVKVAKFFGENSETCREILRRYNALNDKSLKEVDLTLGVKEFLMYASAILPIWAISGGSQEEVQATLAYKNLAHYFHSIMGGPSSKSDNVKKINPQGKILFIGDSQHDFETAEYFGFDFIFMHQYTQFEGWKDFFDKNPPLLAIKNLTTNLL
jgi:phosphoglycolate phosphatase-like HAD superfamily hydrolase